MLLLAMNVIAALIFAPAVVAQNTQSLTYNSIRTPEIQLGSGTAPTTITAPAVVETPSVPLEPQVSNAPPAATEVLATRHFDFIVSPSTEFSAPRGNMADGSISLGEYARQLRAQKPPTSDSSVPNAIAQPTNSR